MTLEEIGRRLDNRFRLLSGGTRRARRRQQTLEAVIAWSHDLLSASEQRCFRRLAVFHGGFFVDAVATVCGVDEGAAAELIDGLVSKSLIDIVTTQGDTRFRLLESIRLFALDRLVESDDPDDARSLHANHYADRWEDPQMSASAHRRHLADVHNMMAAIDWALERGDSPVTVAKLVSLGGPIGAFVERRWTEPGTTEVVRQLISVAESEAVRGIPELLVPFVAATATGSFASFTNDAALRSAVADLDRLAWDVVDVMRQPGFQSPSPSCGLLLLHLAHHLLPDRADEARTWAQRFSDADIDDFSIRAMATMVEQVSLGFLDPSSTAIDPHALLRQVPDGPWTNAIAANAAYLCVVSGRAAEAAELLRLADHDATAGSMADLNRIVAHVATALALGNFHDAMALLVDQIDGVPFGVPGRESTYIALCAWARHLTGSPTRADELIQHTVKRMPQDYLLTCHIKATTESWPTNEFHQRSMEWHDDHTQAGDIVERIDAMPRLLANEVTFWRSRRVTQ